MWIERRINYVKPGQMEEAIALFKEMRFDIRGWSLRLLRPVEGEQAEQMLILEMCFEDPYEFSRAAAWWQASPEGQAFRDRWAALRLKNGSQELLWVVE